MIEIDFEEPCNHCEFLEMEYEEETICNYDGGDDEVNLHIWCDHNHVCSKYLAAKENK